MSIEIVQYKQDDFGSLMPSCIIYILSPAQLGDRGGTVVKVLRYKSEGRWFEKKIPDGVIGIFL